MLRRVSLLVGLLVLLSACHVGVKVGNSSSTTSGPPRILNAVLSTDYQDGKAVGVTTTFSPSDTFHAVVTVANSTPDTKVKAAWTAVDAGGVQDHPIDSKEVTVAQDGAVDFTLSLPHAWPTGRYKADIFLNGNLDRSLEFSVQ